MTSTIIFEPHSDDALLSASSLLLDRSRVTYVITLFDAATDDPSVVDPRTSEGLSDYFPNLKTIHLHHRDVGWSQRRNWRWLINKHSDEVTDYYLSLLPAKWGGDLLENLRQVVLSLVSYGGDWEFFLPLGLIHPGHYLARLILDALLVDRSGLAASGTDCRLHIRYYQDFPYSTFSYGPKLVEKRVREENLVSTKLLGVEVNRHEVKEIFKAVYPTESRILDDWNKKAWMTYDDKFFSRSGK